jgi:hypothetical protein
LDRKADAEKHFKSGNALTFGILIAESIMRKQSSERRGGTEQCGPVDVDSKPQDRTAFSFALFSGFQTVSLEQLIQALANHVT